MEELIIQQAETTRELVSLFGYTLVTLVALTFAVVSLRLNDIEKLVKNKKP